MGLLNLIPGIGQARLISLALGAAAAFGGGFYVAWHWQAANVAREQTRYARYVAGVSAEAAKQAAANLHQQQAWDVQVADITARYQQQKAQDDAQIADLSAAVADGSRGLWVNTAPADGGDRVPKAAAAPGRPHDHPGRARIDPATARSLVAITGACDAQRAKLIALQQYVRSIER